MKNKKLPISVHTFSNLIKGNFLYIDKTKYIYDIINGAEAYFLSRPRRFGKSLLISTLESLFKGDKELFEGLYIKEKTDYDFQEFPVIRLDMSKCTKGEDIDIAGIIKRNAITAIEKNKIKIPEEIKSLKASQILDYAIEELAKQEKVVVLIDEYDAPILNNLTNKERCEEIKTLLADFYGVLKSQNDNLRFIFLTGVTRFAGVSIFSGVNHLQDISLNSKYANLLGITQEELEDNFKEGIKDLAEKESLSIKATTDKIRYWYNGYTFSKDLSAKVYNPFSTLNLFEGLDFIPYWFATGTPTFLINLIKAQEFFVPDINNCLVTKYSFYSTSKDDLAVLPVLYQAGYLTIKDYNKEFESYKLGFPNFEVESALNYSLLEGYSYLQDNQIGSLHQNLVILLRQNDIDKFIEEMKNFFLLIPNNIQVGTREKYYQSLLFCVFKLIGANVEVEVSTNIGFIDMVVKTKTDIYIFEFKLNGTAKEAIEQIKQKNYADKYKTDNKNTTLVGIEFCKKERNIVDYQIIENFK